MQQEDSSFVLALETASFAVCPLAVVDFERNVLVRRTGTNDEQTGFRRVGRRFARVDKIGHENVKLVALHDLWRRIVVVYRTAQENDVREAADSAKKEQSNRTNNFQE